MLVIGNEQEKPSRRQTNMLLIGNTVCFHSAARSNRASPHAMTATWKVPAVICAHTAWA
jgi:hypothetical protein